jgi:hypothetical protein
MLGIRTNKRIFSNHFKTDYGIFPLIYYRYLNQNISDVQVRIFISAKFIIIILCESAASIAADGLPAFAELLGKYLFCFDLSKLF